MLIRVRLVMQEATQRTWQHHNCSDKAVSNLIKALLSFYGVYLVLPWLVCCGKPDLLSREQISVCIWED